MIACAAVLWTAVVVSQSVPASPTSAPPPATGLLVGRVVDGSSGRPVAGAIVTLEGGAVGPSIGTRSVPRALTSSTGQFVFRKVSKGSYQLRATRAGYADGSYGQRRPGGVSASLALDDGQRVGDLVIPIWKHAIISGVVVDEAGEPLVGVQIRAFQRRFVAGRPRVAQAGTTTTDDRGLYRLASLVPGDYLVAFVWREAAVPASVADLLLNSAAMNDPKNNDMMRERMIVSTGFSAPGNANTMQVGGVLRELPQGAPVPPLAAADAPLFIYPTEFYPGVPNAARARAITLASGESRDNVDFALRPVKTARVSGTVIGPDGPVANIAVRLVPANDDSLTELDTSATMTGSAGDFTLLGVPAGQYLIKVQRTPRAAQGPQNTPSVITQVQIGSSMMISTASSGNPSGPPPPVPDDPTLVADFPISVNDADVGDVLVSLQRAARLTGRYEFDGTTPRPDVQATMRIGVSLQRADGLSSGTVFINPPTGHADETGQLKTYGIPPGKYILRVSQPEGWTFRSATADGHDLSDTPFDVRAADVNDVVITFTDRPTKITGIARSAAGSPDPTALVVIFPADGGWTETGVNPRRLRSTRPDRSGSYTFTGLPPGDYYVAAIREETTPQWQDPQVLEELARSATQVHLNDGDARVQDVKAGGGGL